MTTATPYDDNYPTCRKTFVWLRVMSETLEPDAVTKALGVQPTRTQFKGAVGLMAWSKRPAKYSGWFLDSEEHVESLDARRHLDWLLDQLEGKGPALLDLQREGHAVDVCCRWDSVGQGGPTFDPKHLQRLGALYAEFWLEIYFAGDDEGDA